MTRTSILLRLAFLLLLGCVLLLGFFVVFIRPADNLNSVFENSQSVDVARNATSVKAFRLPSPSYFQSLSDYEMASGPFDIPEPTTAKLRTVLLDPSAYVGPDGPKKGCYPDFGVRIQFEEEKDAVDVLICFQCDILAVYHNGNLAGGGDFAPGRSKLLAVVKELFPDDDAIRSLR